MEAMILAAGRGQRLRPLTNITPKSLIKVGECTLIDHHLKKLSQSGFNHLVINTSYLSDKVEKYIGNGSKYGLSIDYSNEPEKPIGTAAGIKQALPLFKSDIFPVINGDVYTDYDFSSLIHPVYSDIHLILVPNPPHNPGGDFGVKNDVLCLKEDCIAPTYTYSGIGLYKRSLFKDLPANCTELGDMIRRLIKSHVVTAEIYSSIWIDVGTIERLQEARNLADNHCC